jgi:hypothetical protein
MTGFFCSVKAIGIQYLDISEGIWHVFRNITRKSQGIDEKWKIAIYLKSLNPNGRKSGKLPKSIRSGMILKRKNIIF